VAVVEGSPIPAAEFRQALNQEVQQRTRFGQQADFNDLLADGTAQRVVESLVSRRLLDAKAREINYHFTKDFLVDQLKEEFKDEEGRFDAERWNQWVKYITESTGQSWNAIYESVADQLRRQLVVAEAAASARVSERDIKREFEEAHTTLDLKYIEIAPPIEPTEEEVRARYDADPSVYDIPAKRKADFAALSLRPPKPPLADEIVERARTGEDFAELAREYSEGVNAAEGGDMGWMTQTPQTPAHQEALFELQPGEVSDAVTGPGGQYFIYKVEEERESEVTGERDVKARRIVLNPRLDPEERAALEAKAQAVMESAKESGDLAAAAAEAGLTVQTSGLFGPDSRTIEGIPPEDVFRFRTGVSELSLGVVSNVIQAQANIYVAKVVELTQPEPQPFEAVKDQAREDTLEAIRRSPEYLEKCEQLAEEIKESVAVLGEVPEKFPELSVVVHELDGFNQQDYASLGGLPINPRQLYAQLADKSPGEVAGPIRDFMGQTYLVQLVAKHPPTDADWEEQWPEERDRLRERALA
ncbi:MAG TPA: hypothetical protein ENN74_04665, partial [Firmicutes bacterium]|nr:hypothetical protein [Bacillota bacterium]